MVNLVAQIIGTSTRTLLLVLVVLATLLMINQLVTNCNVKEVKTKCDPKEAFYQFINDSTLSPLDPAVIKFVQCHHLTPPSGHPYQLEEVGDPSEYSAEIQAIFGNRDTPGFFIECGAVDGEYLSNTLALERDKNWSGLLVEAHPDSLSQLRRRNRKAWISDVCLAPQNSVSELEMLEWKVRRQMWQIGTNKLRSADDKDMVGFNPKGIKVPCFPLMTLLTALGVKHVDFFSLDVEGSDLKILKTLPFNDTLTIDVIEASFNRLPEGADELQLFLESKGYKMTTKRNQDMIFVRKDFLPVNS